MNNMIFPVKVPYTISSDITKYDGELPPTLGSNYSELKKNELDKYRNFLCGGIEYNPLINKFCNLPESYTIKDISLEIEEDIAVLENGILKSICFCFPSGFNPTDKLNLPLFNIHSPVADNEKLLKSNDNLVKVISKKDSVFRRYVWTLTTLNKLSQLPIYDRPKPNSIEDLYFRTETQTTIGLDNQTVLFLVKLNMVKLTLLSNNQIVTIKESIDSMSENVLNYKSLVEIKKILNHNINL